MKYDDEEYDNPTNKKILDERIPKNFMIKEKWAYLLRGQSKYLQGTRRKSITKEVK